MIILDTDREGQVPVREHVVSGRPVLESPDLIAGQNSSEQVNNTAFVAQSAAVDQSGAPSPGRAAPTDANLDLIAAAKDHTRSGSGKN